MILEIFRYNPLLGLLYLLAIVLSLTVHEFSHAWAGLVAGDKTAERSGRLTLNPLAHLDPWGFLFMILAGFGWAKPVPYNPYNLINQKWGEVFVALAGPLSNFLFAALAVIVLRLIGESASAFPVFLHFLIIVNLSLALFNLIPLHPLDGTKLLFAFLDSPRFIPFKMFLFQYGTNILFLIVVLDRLLPFSLFGFISFFSNLFCSGALGETCSAFLYRL